MKVLVISHNVMGNGTNMGKTLQSCFQEFSPGEIAQLYIRREVPGEESLCRNGYCFTDVDALHSLFCLRPLGRIFREGDRTAACGESRLASAVYQYGRRRTARIHLLRNVLWKCSRWKTKELLQWVEAFDPDVVFFASGDYGFLYDIARELAEHVNRPLVVSCVDDFYLYNRWEGSLLGQAVHRSFLKTVRRTMARASAILTICPAMRKEYEALFGRKCHVLYTAAQRQAFPEPGKPAEIVYLGNVSLKRHEQLVEIGQTLQEIDRPGVPKYIHVYSGERNPEILKTLTPENGIRFHGPVSGEEAAEILRGSMAAVHVESFDPALRNRLRFSISTKIPDILANGPCLIAYGPEGIASMDYLTENGGAYTITDPKLLRQGLEAILTDGALRQRTVDRARQLAEKNHRAGEMRRLLAEICGENHENTAN